MRALALVALLAACGGDDQPAAPPPTTIKVAIVGGMTETGFWQAFSTRYAQLTGHTIEVVATGPKPQVVAAFREGGIELITVHVSDVMVNLVADGLAVDPQPWLRNDLVIVGPAADPAGIKGERDARASTTTRRCSIRSSPRADRRAGMRRGTTSDSRAPASTIARTRARVTCG